MISGCQGSRYIAIDPFLLPPPWSTYLAVSLNTRSIGTIPLLSPLVPLMYDPLERMWCIESPIPPADFDIRAHCLSVSYIPTRESSCMVNKKHDDICGVGVPELNRVGVAWVK